MSNVKEAEGFIELGLWQDAWDALNPAPKVGEASSDWLRARLILCPHLDQWSIGENVAFTLMNGSDEDIEAAARFFYQLARKRVQGGDLDLAREAMKIAGIASPRVLEEAERDPLLDPLR